MSDVVRCTEALEDGPCERVAAAVRFDYSDGEGVPYPVCAGHARDVLVPLHLVAHVLATNPDW